MSYYIALFSPKTYETFSKSSRDICGFPPTRELAATKVHPGDKLICYMTKLSRWVGIMEVISLSFKDNTPIFLSENDPFTLRFKVKPLIWLEKEKSIPIHEDEIWNNLSFTKGQDKKSALWTGPIRYGLNLIDNQDGVFLEAMLNRQLKDRKIYEVDEKQYQKFLGHTIRRLDRVVSVFVPEDVNFESEEKSNEPDVRESIRMQALLAKIGSLMGFKIWIPQSDRTRVLKEWKETGDATLTHLPLNYDEITIKTIEQIDVLWLKGRAIIRAFEVEHTTSIYSGILRMADLLALQPNMDIKLHIVAPYERRDKVLQEIQRPVFSFLDRRPLAESCTYISYDSIKELAESKHLSHLSDTVLDEYAEEAE
jgi:predicted RNA-binding protein